jgi:biopolymer transport protein ExbB
MIERFLSLRKITASSAGIVGGFRKMITHGLVFAQKHGPGGLDEMFNSFKALERPSLEKNLQILGTIASNAPYVGLLGTVMGIMKAFNDLAVAPGQGNEVVMAGIGHALVSTAVGLAVAIPAVAAFNYFSKKVGQVLSNIDAARDLCLAYTKSRKG